MPSPRQVLYVHHRSYLGGAPASLGGLIRGLDPQRFQATVYCPAGPAAESFRAAGATVITGPIATFTHVWASSYSGLRWLLFGRELSRLPATVARFGAVLRARRFDLVHLNDVPLVYTGALAHRAGLPVVWHLRSSFARGGEDLRSRLIGGLIDRTGSAVIAIDDDVARSYPGRASIDVVHNSVDLERFMPAPGIEAKHRLGLAEDRVAIGLFGHIYEKKGWPDFIAAAQRLLGRRLPVQFVISGGGVRPPEFFDTLLGRALTVSRLTANEEQQARDLVHELGIDEHVHFLPFADDPRDVYRALDIVTFPNRGAGLGRPVIEAAACGRPVVASGSSGGAGLLEPGRTGELVPSRSPDALAAALERLVVDERLREELGANARRHAEESFDARRNTERVMEIYDRVVGNQRLRA